jgi:hypothetical protein
MNAETRKKANWNLENRGTLKNDIEQETFHINARIKISVTKTSKEEEYTVRLFRLQLHQLIFLRKDG